MGELRATTLAGWMIALAAMAPAAPAAPAIDHGPFDALLRKHVVEGFVDYPAFQRAPQFGAYLDSLAAVQPESLPEPARLAFWLNAYNAWTIRLINVNGERESIRNIAGGKRAASQGPWAQPIAALAGKTLSLDQIEHDVIRARFDDPRVHFALVCAATGCPPLRPEAYDAERLDEQLDDQARLFLEGSPEKNRVDVASRTVYLSPLFEWFRADFGASDAALGQFLARYQSHPAARRLLEQGRFTIRWTTYDWSLNDRSRLAAAPYQIYERMLLLAQMDEPERLERAFSLVEPLASEHAVALGRPADEITKLIRAGAPAERLRGVRKLVAHDVATLLLGVGNAPPERARTLLKTASLEWKLLGTSGAAEADLSARLAAAVGAVDTNRLAEARAHSVGVARDIVPLF